MNKNSGKRVKMSTNILVMGQRFSNTVDNIPTDIIGMVIARTYVIVLLRRFQTWSNNVTGKLLKISDYLTQIPQSR